MSSGKDATSRTPRPVPWRSIFMVPAGLSLLAGLNAAFTLLDLPAPIAAAHWAEVHGMVLALGFIGTLVALERAVALGKPAGYLSPLFLGVGSLMLLTPLSPNIGKVGLVLGTAALIWVYLPLWRRQRDNAVLVQMLGAGLGTGAALLWLGGLEVNLLLPWLVAFVVLTIAGERVELARITMGAVAGRRVLQLSWVLSFGVVASLLTPVWGSLAFGAGLLVLTLWLAANDIAKRTIKATGATRFMAACMLAGYAWLIVAAVIWCFGFPASQARYDGAIHSVFLGFTISMIIAHSSTILPAILRRPLPYRPMMWAPAILLHLGLLIRLWFGDGLGYQQAWVLGSVITIVAVLLFFVLAIISVALGEKQAAKPTPKPTESASSLSLCLMNKPTGLTIAEKPGPTPGLGLIAKPRATEQQLLPVKETPHD